MIVNLATNQGNKGHERESAGFNVPHDTLDSETSLSRQSIALVMTANNKETKHYIHPSQKTEQCTPTWYTFYDF